MIGKQIRVRYPRATLQYISSKDKAVFVDSNLAGQTVNQQLKELEFVTRQNRRKEYKYFHVILSLPPGETTDRWAEIIQVQWQQRMWQQEVKRQFKAQVKAQIKAQIKAQQAAQQNATEGGKQPDVQPVDPGRGGSSGRQL